MTKQTQAAALAASVALVFVALQAFMNVQTAIAGVFVMGIAGGLLLGNEMGKPPKP